MFRPGVVKNNTPANFEKALVMVKNYVDTHPDQALLVTINSCFIGACLLGVGCKPSKTITNSDIKLAEKVNVYIDSNSRYNY